MNESHYPSLELCKKLKEIGFPDTEYSYVQDLDWKDFIYKYKDYGRDEYTSVCPSVMEMLDVIPYHIQFDWMGANVHFTKRGDGEYISYYSWKSSYYKGKNTLPNALAEMIIWLYENKHLTFQNGN